MSVNAEGVETRAQFEALRWEGCGEIQGFYFSQPRPVKDIAELLLAHGNATLPLTRSQNPPPQDATTPIEPAFATE
jgi:predicted signal transduction protein with EAL and GGDEF domain